MKLHYGDMTDTSCLVKIINEIQPDEVYNLAAQSHVKVIILLIGRKFIKELTLPFFIYFSQIQLFFIFC